MQSESSGLGLGKQPLHQESLSILIAKSLQNTGGLQETVWSASGDSFKWTVVDSPVHGSARLSWEGCSLPLADTMDLNWKSEIPSSLSLNKWDLRKSQWTYLENGPDDELIPRILPKRLMGQCRQKHFTHEKTRSRCLWLLLRETQNECRKMSLVNTKVDNVFLNTL